MYFSVYIFSLFFYLQFAYQVFPCLADVNKVFGLLRIHRRGQLSYMELGFHLGVFYSPEVLFVSSGGVFLGLSMNNMAEYSVVLELLHDFISHGIHSLEVHLDSHLVVC